MASGKIAKWGSGVEQKKVTTTTGVAPRGGTRSRPAPRNGLLANCTGADAARLEGENGQLRREVEKLEKEKADHEAALDELKESAAVSLDAVKAVLEPLLKQRDNFFQSQLRTIETERDQCQGKLFEKMKLDPESIALFVEMRHTIAEPRPISELLNDALGRFGAQEDGNSSTQKKKKKKKKKNHRKRKASEIS